MWLARNLLLVYPNAVCHANPDMRRVLCILLMLFLPLHGFAMQAGWASSVSAYDIAHELDHLAGVVHHHDDDHGTTHYDNSSDSAQHLAEHSAGHACAALPPAAMPPLTIVSFISVVSEPSHYIPDPVPERLQRPPKHLG